MKYLLLFSLLFSTSTIFALPDKGLYLNKLLELCPNADIISFEPKDGFVEIDYQCEGKFFTVGINTKLELVFTESEAKIDTKTLAKLDNKLNKKYSEWIFKGYTLVEMADTSFYKAELWKDGVEENIYFALDGKYFRLKSFLVNEPWTLADLTASTYYQQAPYRFLEPDHTYEMPEILKEISGMTLTDDHTMYAVQDENGIVFKYNLAKEEITGMFRFTDVGDFEDVATVGDMVYALRSDGTVFYFNGKNYNGKFDQKVVQANSMNMEGLFYNPTDKYLYMACKDQPLNLAGTKRLIYKFTPQNMEKPHLTYTIELTDLQNKLKEHYPQLNTENVQFNPSAIAIHPLTGEIFVLSAANKLLITLNEQGINGVYPLPSELYFKPEGLAFSPEGDLYLSSEGFKNGFLNGSIYLFKKQ
jgi:uncharacterized protein YjiK